MILKLVALTSVLVVLINLFGQPTSAGSLKCRHSNNIGDPASDQALEALAARLNAMTNLSADPCDDFYEFACGGAIQQQGEVSMSSELIDVVKSRVNSLLTGPTDNVTDGLKLIRNLFTSYKGEEASRIKNFEIITPMVRKLGGIPAIGERSGWVEGTQTSWPDLAVQLRRLGMKTDLFFRWDVRQDHLNGNRSAIYMSLPDEYSSGNDHTSIKYEVLVTKLMMPDMTKAEEAKFIKNIESTVDFRRQLSDIIRKYRPTVAKPNERAKDSSGIGGLGFKPYKKLQSKDFQLMPIRSLELLVPQLDWAGLLSELFQYPVSSETDIFVHKPEAFVEVLRLINGQPNPEVLRNFMMLEAILDATSFSRYDFSNFPFKEEVGLLLSAEYVRNYLLPETRASARIMVGYLRRELKAMIGQADWISDMAKQGALAKADSLILHVGYPDELLDETSMAELYSGLELGPDNFVQNLLSLNRWTSRYESVLLKRPFRETSWHVFKWATDFNSYYNPWFNSINVLPTMVQGLLYNQHQPNYVNFAALGSTASHEISHAFDSNWVKYDCNGQDHCWWDPKTGAEYQQRSKCFEQQYNGSQAFGPFAWLNGSHTLGENIADNIGAKIARRAYQSWLADQPAGYEEPLLTGSLAKYNQDQLYWTSMAQFWCEKEQSESRKDPHSPDKLRVDITLTNQVEFAEAFKCPIASRMNPRDKCAMW